jgi:hypothetical protein
LASLFIGHAAQKSKLHNLQYDEGGNHMAETETYGRMLMQSQHPKQPIHVSLHQRR